MELCEYVFSIGFPLYVPKNEVFEGEDVKILPSNSQKAHPAWIRVCWCFACQNRFKKLSDNFGYMERSNPCRGDLDQMSLVGRYGGRNHVCNIWLLSVKECGCGESGNFAFSHWLDASPLQHWSHDTVWPRDDGTVEWLCCTLKTKFSDVLFLTLTFAPITALRHRYLSISQKWYSRIPANSW